MGRAKLIEVAVTEYIPQATPLIEIEVPLSSIGRAGERVDSDAFALLTEASKGAGVKVNWATANSPGASPGATNGLVVGTGLAVGEATGIKLAPVNSEIDPA